MNKKIIYCLDCEAEFAEALNKQGFETHMESLGYQIGVQTIKEPPNECDVMVFNLTNPGYFDMKSWGPDGGNDNFRFKLVKKIDKSMYSNAGSLADGRKYPRFRLIQESQMLKLGSTFKFSHIQKAISEGGIDCIYYLNPCFMSHCLYHAPNWVGLEFLTDITKANRWNVSEKALKICSSLGKIGIGDLELVKPIEYKLLELIPNSKEFINKITKIELIATNVKECLAAIVKFGNGYIYFLPPFVNPVQGTVALINDVLPAFRAECNKDLAKSAISRIAGIAVDSINQPSESIRTVIGGREKLAVSPENFVNEERIRQLESVSDKSFDLLKVLQFLKEINSNYEKGNYLSVILLIRALIDHVPPIFAKKSFAEVVNNCGSRSFKESMETLDNTCRKIADQYLHGHVRKKEVLPNKTQVNFSHNIDLLLAEIVRILK